MLELIRQNADWLAGTVLDWQGNPQGLAVHLAALTYDGSDTAPATPVVTNETGDGITARRELPDGDRVCTVSLFSGDWDPAYVTMEQQGRATLLIRFGIRGEVSSDEAIRDTYYYSRAAKRSLLRLYLPENGVRRTRGDIDFYHDPQQPIQIRRVEADRNDDHTTYGLLVSYLVREKDP